jgi:PAS domain S-box-containing protein
MEADAQSLELVLEALQRSEQRYRSLVEATASFVWVARPDGALISDMPRWREITGQSVDELLGSGWMEVIHPDDRPAVAAAWRQAVRHAGPYAVEYRIRERDGGLRHLFVRGTPVFAPDGRVREFIGLCIDVTERAQLAAALDQERALLQQVVDEMPVGVALVWGEDWVFRVVNQRYYELVPAERLLGRPVREALPEAWEAARKMLAPAFDGSPQTFEDVPIRWGGGDERFYRVSTSPVPDETGAVGGVLVVVVDTTEEVRRRAGLEERLAQERSTAETLQRALLPESLPAVQGLHCAVRYTPGGGELLVGGDFYDVLELDDPCRVGVAVGDVAGRGVRAAAVMGQLRAALRAYAAEAPDDVAGVIERTSEFFVRFEPAEMATLLYGVADARERTLVHAVAGHLPPLVLEPGRPPRVATTTPAPPLGVRAGPYRAEAIGPLPAGSTIVLYTDGLVERRREPIDAGLERLRQAAAGRERDSLATLCDHLVSATGAEVEHEDDLALLAIRFV